jgi:hypothetical protein
VKKNMREYVEICGNMWKYVENPRARSVPKAREGKSVVWFARVYTGSLSGKMFVRGGVWKRNKRTKRTKPVFTEVFWIFKRNRAVTEA